MLIDGINYEDGDINKNNVDGHGNTLLGVAILNKQWNAALALLDIGAQADIIINNSPEHGSNVQVVSLPMQYNRWNLVERLIRVGANPKDYWNNVSPLGYFVQKHNIDMVNFILTSNYGPNVINFPPEHSPLKIAAIAGHLSMVKTLVAAGAKIDTKEFLDGNGEQAQYKFTPVQFAAMFGHLGIVRFLMSCVKHKDEFVNENMGFSLDLFGQRGNYSADIDINEMVNSMLLFNGIEYANDDAGRKKLRRDVLLLQAGAKHYAVEGAVPRLTGKRKQINTKYLNRAILALQVIRRSLNQPPIINPSSNPEINRIVVLQKMAFEGFCVSITTYVRNSDVDANNPVWKVIGYLGSIIDCVADRGYFHGNQLIRDDTGKFFDGAWINIVWGLELLSDFIIRRDNETLQALKDTPFYQISAYLNDYEQLSKLNNLYIDFNEADLRSNDRIKIEAALNTIAATLEIITVHLSDISRAYFHDLDFSVLSQIRNHLRHVNGDNHCHDVFANRSRALRFENLVNRQSPIFMDAIINFMRNDISEIRIRVNSYQAFLKSIDNQGMLYQKFRISTGKIANFRNTLWSYSKFANYRRGVTSLLALLEASDNNYPQEGVIQRHLRINTTIDQVLNEQSLRLWNSRVRVALGLNGDYIKGLQPSAKKKLKFELNRLLPNKDQMDANIIGSEKICCYVRYAANIHYAISSLRSIVEINVAMQQRMDPRLWKSYYSALEWNTVHFHEHACDLIKDQIFKNTYDEQHGNTTQLLLDMEQMRNYIAHVANLKFVNQQGVGTSQYQLFSLCKHAQDILKGFEHVEQQFKNLFDELEKIAPANKLQEISEKAIESNTSNNWNSMFAGKQLFLTITGIAASAGAIYCYYNLPQKNIKAQFTEKFKLH